MNMRDIGKISDEILVGLVCKKNQEFYNEIVKRYQDKLMRYLIYLIKDKDKAEDVAQNTFIKAFVNLKGFDVEKKFSSWIYRIAHNEAMNFIKKHKREISIDANETIFQNIASDIDIEKKYQSRELKKLVASYFKQIPLKYREPLALFFLEDKPYQEISDILRMPIGTVGTRINRGKTLLKELHNQS